MAFNSTLPFHEHFTEYVEYEENASKASGKIFRRAKSFPIFNGFTRLLKYDVIAKKDTMLMKLRKV